MTTKKISAVRSVNSKFCATTSTVQEHNYEGIWLLDPTKPYTRLLTSASTKYSWKLHQRSPDGLLSKGACTF